MEILECPFCKEQENRNNNILGKSRILAETNNFVVFPTTGGFVKNYQLVVPKHHINCFGQLSNNEILELNGIIEWQKNINMNYFNMNTSMFEHGALYPINESGKSIVHAHLHIFPNKQSLISEISKYNFDIIKIDDIKDLKDICHKYAKYLYYCDIDGQNYVITHDGIPSQFLRKVLADSVGEKDWNWRKNPMIDSIEENIDFYNKNKIIYKKKWR